MKCEICKQEIIGYGHNGQPVVNGKVCDNCNIACVLPERFRLND